MKYFIYASSLIMICGCLCSCSSIMRSAGGLMQAVGRSVGLNMTDAPVQPITNIQKTTEKSKANRQNAAASFDIAD